MRKILFTLAAILFLFIVYLAASPYLTVYQIKQALAQNDAEALAQHINFPAVRQDVKLQIHYKIEQKLGKSDANNPMVQMLGNVFLNNMADKLLEHYITAEGIKQLMQGVDPTANHGSNKQQVHTSNSDAALSNAQSYYQSLDTFLVEVKTNQQGDLMTLRLSRTGLTWQLTGIQLPW